MINVGIIGSGFIVPIFIEATQTVKGYRYVGIASPVEEQLKNLKEKYGISYYSLNNDDVLSDPKIDVIYVAVPNGLHYEIAKKALENNKHVIVEKPFMPSYAQAKELIDLAKKKKRIIFDAVTLIHMPNYEKIRALLPELGDIKMIDINFSQYSSRYDKFKKGIVLPAFDYKQAGGALMDLGIYNINFITGLFGTPKKVEYFPNMHQKIDTSGVLVMDYGSFKATSVAAKDCRAPLSVCIQGDLGYIKSDEASSVIMHVRHVKNDGTVKEYKLNKHMDSPHYHEYTVFKQIFNKKDLKQAQKLNSFTLKTMKVLDEALSSGKIKFK
ncbi:MAG: Gfo/Idh/MocA family oxidoreductase [Erysipelotrichaceae bacterium]|nr:Gfo/Idh/MocA family oxidoreductase [Erysipelotrichaceae bacterium]